MLETVGILCCFLVLVLFDINDVLWKKKAGRVLFFAGMGGILIISIRTVVRAVLTIELPLARVCVFTGMTVLFLILLIYTLFFAIPAEEAYSEMTVKHTERRACTSGMYALSRHPGVIWMSLLYASLLGALPTKEMAFLFLATTICNIGYVVMQDLWTFPQLFCNYTQYKKMTPFLLPTGKSIKKCIRTWKHRES